MLPIRLRKLQLLVFQFEFPALGFLVDESRWRHLVAGLQAGIRTGAVDHVGFRKGLKTPNTIYVKDPKRTTELSHHFICSIHIQLKLINFDFLPRPFNLVTSKKALSGNSVIKVVTGCFHLFKWEEWRLNADWKSWTQKQKRLLLVQ